jgi:alpha-galactosidase
VVTNGDVHVYEKQLEDGGRALGFFNLGSAPANLEFNQLAQLGFTGAQHIRDLWRQNNLPDVNATGGVLKMTIPIHGVMLYKLTAAAARNSGT